MMFPDVCGGVVKTVSTRLVAVQSSRASSLLFRIVYPQTYLSPIFVGDTHPFENQIPCSSCASAPVEPNASRTQLNARPITTFRPNDHAISCSPFPLLIVFPTDLTEVGAVVDPCAVLWLVLTSRPNPHCASATRRDLRTSRSPSRAVSLLLRSPS